MNAAQVEIDRIAEEYYKLKQAGADTANEYYKLFGQVYLYVCRRRKYSASNGLYENDYDMLGSSGFYDLLQECLDKWAPGDKGFSSYFISIFNYRVKTAVSKINKAAAKEKSYLLDPNGNDEFDILENVKDDTVDVAAETMWKQREKEKIFADCFKRLYDGVRMAVKKYENSTKICYYPYFFTERVTRAISTADSASDFSLCENELMARIDHNFVSFYAVGKNETVKDIYRLKLKKCSEFTDKGDVSKPCGYPLLNYVYVNYISPLKYGNSGKKLSESSITQQRDKFNQLVHNALDDKIL